MADTHELVEPSPLVAGSAASSTPGTLVAWTASSGDATKSHLVHVAPTGLACALNLKEQDVFGRIVGEATARPADAAELVGASASGFRVSREQLARVAYTEQLNQLIVSETGGKKHKIPHGNKGEQKKVFDAVSQHLGGTASEEEADAWSVMQTPLFSLAVTAVIGGFFIFLAANSDPNYQATGRRSGMKQLLNWLGYTIGPVWMSVIVGSIAALILAFMIFLLVKRPKRLVLTF